ncbi:universal stress protein [Amycolatopsis panacis]|uniref:Universal stress protein n=1 Tax=Amycolatopsis panacis TaxID=2340917 RepID=A0A419HZ25_9PSEU|nr:universal stress protein [Amycolatopsis panacis]RJQ82493.1 universal stress protein [Amycolatopsis panacis]
MNADGAVLVGVDESEASLAAVRWAAAEAVRRGCLLRLLQAGMGDTTDLPGQDGRVHRWLSRAARVAEESAPGVRVQQMLRVGLAADLLVEASRSVSLLVLGSHGLGGLRGAAIGSVALRVAATARCPVVVVRGHASPEGAVVVGVEADERAVEFAFEAAASRRAPLVAVHAWHEGAFEDPGRAAAEKRALRARIAPWADKYPGVTVQIVATQERSAARALMAVEAPHLIVIGSRGRGPVTGGLFGSTGNRLLADAACPVAVVH